MKINKIYRDFIPPPPGPSEQKCGDVRFPAICKCAGCRYTQPEWCEVYVLGRGFRVLRDGLPLSKQQIKRAVVVLGYDKVCYLADLVNKYLRAGNPTDFVEYLRITKWSLEPKEMDTAAIRQAAWIKMLEGHTSIPSSNRIVDFDILGDDFGIYTYAD